MSRVINLTRFIQRSSCLKVNASVYNLAIRVNHVQSLTKRTDLFQFHDMKSQVLQLREFQLNTVCKTEQDVTVPTLPDSVVEGDLKLIKKVGDVVTTDEVVAEIETDKMSIPVVAPGSGVVVELYVEDSATVKSNQKLFRMKMGPAKPGSAPPTQEPLTKGAPSPALSQPKVQKQIATPPEVKFPVKPPQVLQGAVIKVPPQDPTKEITGLRSEHRVKLNRMRQRIAQRLKDAQNTYAMLTTINEIDMSYIMEFRKTHQEAFTKKYGVKLGFMSAFLRACVYALQDQPVVNAVIVDKEIIYRDYIDISVAVASPKGLLVPVIRNVDKMNYADIEKAINTLSKKAKEGKISIEDMDGGTFTVSNGGVFGSLMGTPIINPPQSAILGMHGIFEKPVAVNHQVVIRPMMYVALTYDHRLIDGREAVLFLRKIKGGVENPTTILCGV